MKGTSSMASRSLDFIWVMRRSAEVIGPVRGLIWLAMRHNVLRHRPVILVFQGRAQDVVDELGRVEHGIS